MVLVAGAKAFGFDLGLTTDDLTTIGSAIAMLLISGNIVMRVITDKRKGLQNKS